MKKIVALTGCFFVILASGCATSKKVQQVQVGDEKLSCGEIRGEFKRLDDAQANIDDKK